MKANSVHRHVMEVDGLTPGHDFGSTTVPIPALAVADASSSSVPSLDDMQRSSGLVPSLNDSMPAVVYTPVPPFSSPVRPPSSDTSCMTTPGSDDIPLGVASDDMDVTTPDSDDIPLGLDSDDIPLAPDPVSYDTTSTLNGMRVRSSEDRAGSVSPPTTHHGARTPGLPASVSRL